MSRDDDRVTGTEDAETAAGRPESLKTGPDQERGERAASDREPEGLDLLRSSSLRGRLVLSSEADRCPSSSSMGAYLEGRLSRLGRRRFERHLNRCALCTHLLARTWADEVRGTPAAAPVRRRAEAGQRPSLRPVLRWPSPVATLVAAVLVLVVAGTIHFGLGERGQDRRAGIASSQPPTAVALFLHSSHIQRETMRDGRPGPHPIEKKVTGEDFLRIDVPLLARDEAWALFFFDGSGQHIDGIALERRETGEGYVVRAHGGTGPGLAVEVLDGSALIEVEAGPFLGKHFGLVHLVGVGARAGTMNDERARIIEDLSACIAAADCDAARDGGVVLAKIGKGPPAAFGADSIRYDAKPAEDSDEMW